MAQTPHDMIVLESTLLQNLDAETEQAIRELQLMAKLSLVCAEFPFFSPPWLRLDVIVPDYQTLQRTVKPAQAVAVCTTHATMRAAKQQGFAAVYWLGPATSLASDLDAQEVIPISHLSQLEFGMRQQQGHPMSYEVTVHATHEKYLRSFVAWLRREHLAEVCAAGSCVDARVVQLSPTTVKTSYLFRNQSFLDNYIAHHAPALRNKAIANFPETMLRFERATWHVVTNY